MRQGLADKLWFMHYFVKSNPIDIYLDWGCADGSLIWAIEEIDPGKQYIGFDLDCDMLNKAVAKKIEGARFTFLRDDTIEWVMNQQQDGKKVCLILSSVLHELETYIPFKDREKLYQLLFGAGFDYIAIRDMGCRANKRGFHSTAFHKRSGMKVHKKIAEKGQELIKKYHTSHIARWGACMQFKSLAKWLLTYPYIDNWERENEENYLIDIDYFDTMIKETGYENILTQEYIPFWIKSRIKLDFDIDFDEPTHVKLLYKLK